MPITLGDASQRIRSALGNNEPTAMSAVGLVDIVGQRIWNLRPWKFRERTSRLNLRADITLTGATWTEATKTLTKTAAFTNYTHLAGDEVKITSGTGATAGYYPIASKTSANAIVLETSIGAGADTQTDIAGTMNLWAMALPSDFLEMLSVYPASSSNQSLNFVPLSTLIEARRNSISGSGFYASVVNATLAAGGAPVPRLELSGAASGNTLGAYNITYRCNWTFTPSGASDSFVLPVPEFLIPFFVEYLMLYARAVENNDPDGATTRLNKLLNGPEFVSAVVRDGLSQSDYGPIQNGAIQMASMLGFTPTPTLETTLLDPT